MLKSIFFSPTPKNLDNPGGKFRIIGGFPVSAEKMDCIFGIYTPKNIY